MGVSRCTVLVSCLSPACPLLVPVQPQQTLRNLRASGALAGVAVGVVDLHEGSVQQLNEDVCVGIKFQHCSARTHALCVWLADWAKMVQAMDDVGTIIATTTGVPYTANPHMRKGWGTRCRGNDGWRVEGMKRSPEDK